MKSSPPGRIERSRVAYTLPILFLIFVPPVGNVQTAPAPELCQLVESGKLTDLRWPDFSNLRTHVKSFYEPASYAPGWTIHGVPTDPARSLIRVFQEADTKGLDPEDYDGSRWADRLAALNSSSAPNESALSRFDLALTVCVLRYISDLHVGKANPGLYHTGFDLNGNLADFVRERLVSSSNVEAALQGIEPPFPGYGRTERALQQYLAMLREDRSVALPVPKKTLDPRSSYGALASLADRLRQLGDLPCGALPSGSNVYTEPLVGAVKRFQTRHGLAPDGRIGAATFAELNAPLSRRVRQLQLTLERWRWAPHRFSRPPIVVNIPEFQVRAFNDTYRTGLEMKVVVGKSYGHQTPVFAAEMKTVIFRPYWEVPRSILTAELLPKAAQDRSYFVKHGFEAVTMQGAVASAGVVDDDTLARLRSGELRVRQVPGPENSLGLVKFVFPNPYDVYLHATPATELFARSRRDFSHGCIRVEKPEELAAWVLRGKPEWTPEHIHEVMHGDKTVEVTLDQPIPVLIVYATAVVLESGEVRFFDDIYKEDVQLERLLAQGYPPRPKSSPAKNSPAEK